MTAVVVVAVSAAAAAVSSAVAAAAAPSPRSRLLIAPLGLGVRRNGVDVAVGDGDIEDDGEDDGAVVGTGDSACVCDTYGDTEFDTCCDADSDTYRGADSDTVCDTDSDTLDCVVMAGSAMSPSAIAFATAFMPLPAAAIAGGLKAPPTFAAHPVAAPNSASVSTHTSASAIARAMDARAACPRAERTRVTCTRAACPRAEGVSGADALAAPSALSVDLPRAFFLFRRFRFPNKLICICTASPRLPYQSCPLGFFFCVFCFHGCFHFTIPYGHFFLVVYLFLIYVLYHE
jgi:hypothetical protein